MNLNELVSMRNTLAMEHRNLYLRKVNELNTELKSQLDNSIGYQLFVACKDDLLGEMVRRFFNTSDYYITVDQLWKRIKTFDYNTDYDPLNNDEGYKKSIYNYNDEQRLESFKSTTGQWINQVNENLTQVFPEKRTGTEPLYDENGEKHRTRTAYKQTLNDGKRTMNDDLTEKEVDKDTLQGDHIIALNSAKVNARYLKDSFFEERDTFYNSTKNMQFINARANIVKSDAATLKETIEKWEKTGSEEAKKILTEAGYLNEDGKVNKEVKKNLEKNIGAAENAESKHKLKHTNYKKVGSDSVNQTAKAIPKIMVGQLVYYSLPPIIYEVRRIIETGVNSVDEFFTSFDMAIKRTVNYVASNMKNMFKNVAHSSIKKLVKTFFDILISLVKNTVRRILKIIKDIALSIIDSIRILFNKNATKAEKADSILKLLSVTIANSLVIVGLELLEKKLGLPAYAMEAFELMGIIIISNILTLILNKADLFDVRYGFKVLNLQNLIDEHHISYHLEANSLIEAANKDTSLILDKVNLEIQYIKKNLSESDLYSDDALSELDKINKIFNMEIDFNKEWQSFIGKEILV